MTDHTTDAPSLVSLLAEMRLHIESFAALRVCGATPKAQGMAQEAVDRTTNAVVDLVRGLRDERDEALRLLRVAATTPQCMECIEERGDARLATYIHEDVSGTHVDVARYYCDECAVRHLDAEEATFAADVRRIAKLTA